MGTAYGPPAPSLPLIDLVPGALPPLTYRARVDADHVVAFALATNDPNPRYLDGDAVPPLFTVTLILDAFQKPLVEFDERAVTSRASVSVHGQHDVWFHRPVIPGTPIRYGVGFHGATQNRGGVLITRRLVLCDAEGGLLVEHFWSSIHIGARLDGNVGSAPPDHAFPESARVHPVGRKSVPVDRDQTFRYAGVSGDHNGHAVDDEIARREGYPGKILQGLCTFALTSGAVVDVAAGGDPGRLRRVAARFAAPAFPQHDLAVDVYDAGPTEGGGRAFAFECGQGDAVVIRHGRAEVTGG